MNICVFCSAQDVPEKYQRAAAEFAGLLGASGHALVWGGSDRGLMHVVAEGVKNEGGKIIGITMELVRHKAHQSADEMIVAKTLGERKATMLERCDAIVALVGGIGTLDEITEVIALKRHGTHRKPIILLNTDNFFSGLKMQLETMNTEGFLESRDGDVVKGLEGIAYFAQTPREAIEYLNAHGD